mmetsp:Transcript_4198/g.6755  ORF Transcript_4198/g.6755 Transcript_4198/m.6755 type:complete len:92 (-) Transcript_4198:152-427(-)
MDFLAERLFFARGRAGCGAAVLWEQRPVQPWLARRQRQRRSGWFCLPRGPQWGVITLAAIFKKEIVQYICAHFLGEEEEEGAFEAGLGVAS